MSYPPQGDQQNLENVVYMALRNIPSFREVNRRAKEGLVEYQHRQDSAATKVAVAEIAVALLQVQGQGIVDFAADARGCEMRAQCVGDSRPSRSDIPSHTASSERQAPDRAGVATYPPSFG